MRSMSIDAGNMALEELKQGRKTMILFPSGSWSCVAFEMGTPPEGVYLRFSEDHENLKEVEVDIIILVAANDNDWDEEGLLFVDKWLANNQNRRVLTINRVAK